MSKAGMATLLSQPKALIPQTAVSIMMMPQTMIETFTSISMPKNCPIRFEKAWPHTTLW